MKKALVYYLYGTKNAGDMAICVGTVEVLRNRNYDVTLVSRFSHAEEEYRISKAYIQSYFPDVLVFPGPFSFEREFSAVRKLLAYGSSFARVCGLVADERTKNLINESDVVFFNGGNLLRGESLKDYMRLAALFYPIRLAYKAGKPVYCLPQSTAGISPTGKRLLSRCLRYFTKIYIREKKSLEALQTEFPDIDFTYCTDMAFFCEDTEKAKKVFRETYGDLSSKRKTALVLRNSGIGDIGRIDKETEQKLLGTMRAYVQAHPDQEYWVVVQTLKDRQVSEKFIELINDNMSVRIVEEHDPLVLRELYKHMEFIITMRLHAGILALSAHVPVIGLFCGDWGLKNPGMMESFDMPYILADQESGDVSELAGRLPGDVSDRIAGTIERYKEVLTVNRIV